MNILIVKLSSLGDVVHAMPAVQDIHVSMPHARIDWVVERAFAPLVQRCEGVRRAVPLELRRWSRSPLSPATRHGWRAFRHSLREVAYDAVLDLQGLTKSALVARAARLSAAGKRYALANQTEGSSYEAPTRWLADVAVPVPSRSHAVQRSRELCAMSLGYAMPTTLRWGLLARPVRAAERPCIAFVHGTSREDKCWPQEHWLRLGRQLVEEGFAIGLPHGSDLEQQRSAAIAAGIGAHAVVWPRMDLAALTDRLAGCAGVIGVDSGLSHIAVALELPHVQVYNFDTAWRTGPIGPGPHRSVYGSPCPSPEAVWEAWRAVRPR
ncbi:lipopolysaccharide heptosyltransferase I [Ramlibacter henchirensis]|uniref:Lipopolysaccharide heptosyltransferase 1 n=1 Tax=Ramlibacter henchirensis TaxID=204072 RepID=A0A4Z0C4Y4_9BURK|nr:lipopolysaccharide heptosyltransferase I [Ramlibacter henchirensis]TFZ05992.1 lipopolysaccharide heptosyltransferase I [Ramlibacter henchirensis]